MVSVVMLLGGALVNALTFSGSNYLFSMLRSSGVDQERKRNDKESSSYRLPKQTGPGGGLNTSTG